MKNAGTLKLTAHGDRELVMTRAFDAPRSLVFDAFTKPDLVKRWLLGPDGWSMPACEIDLRVGGGFRYLWRHTNGNEMGMRGVYREIVVPERIVSTEKFDESGTPVRQWARSFSSSRADRPPSPRPWPTSRVRPAMLSLSPRWSRA